MAERNGMGTFFTIYHWVSLLQREINEEKAGRREWVLRHAEIDSQLEQLRKGPLAGIHINGRHPTDRPLEATSDIDLVEPVVHIGGQFSVTTQDLHYRFRLQFS
ncbi:hypothetical protein K438DRAFT_1762896 [Mycena galopus ATCC 62051]|nr:hypothetical protein K438DRAFT_1762896 [Mycena galopus ATCC 62051]